MIALYQRALSPYFGFHCRYVPSCSEYMKEAVATHGAIKGIGLGIARLFRCAPWGGSGLDLVHEKQR